MGPGKGIPLTTRLFGRPVAAKSGPRIPIGDAVTQTLGSEDAQRAEESRLYSTMLRSAESHLGMLVSMIGFVPIDRRAEFQAAVVGGFQHRAGVLWPEPGNEWFRLFLLGASIASSSDVLAGKCTCPDSSVTIP